MTRAPETEGRGGSRETGLEETQAAQIVDLFREKTQVLQTVQGGFQTGEDRVAALKGIGAEKEIEHRRFFGHPLFEVAGQHGQFVQIGEQG